MPFWTMASVRVSMLEVASSRISTGGSAMAARAMARSCRCPWESCSPSPVSMSVVPLGQSLNKLIRVGQFRCRVYLLIGGVQFSVPDVLLD